MLQRVTNSFIVIKFHDMLINQTPINISMLRKASKQRLFIVRLVIKTLHYSSTEKHLIVNSMCIACINCINATC